MPQALGKGLRGAIKDRKSRATAPAVQDELATTLEGARQRRIEDALSLWRDLADISAAGDTLSEEQVAQLGAACDTLRCEPEAFHQDVRGLQTLLKAGYLDSERRAQEMAGLVAAGKKAREKWDQLMADTRTAEVEWQRTQHAIRMHSERGRGLQSIKVQCWRLFAPVAEAVARLQQPARPTSWVEGDVVFTEARR